MALAVTHQFVSAIPDGPDDTVVQPSDWNATHAISGDFDDATGTINGVAPSALAAQYSLVQLLLMGT